MEERVSGEEAFGSEKAVPEGNFPMEKGEQESWTTCWQGWTIHS